MYGGLTLLVVDFPSLFSRVNTIIIKEWLGGLIAIVLSQFKGREQLKPFGDHTDTTINEQLNIYRLYIA